jgi:hypothetical protein
VTQRAPHIVFSIVVDMISPRLTKRSAGLIEQNIGVNKNVVKSIVYN